PGRAALTRVFARAPKALAIDHSAAGVEARRHGKGRARVDDGDIGPGAAIGGAFAVRRTIARLRYALDAGIGLAGTVLALPAVGIDAVGDRRRRARQQPARYRRHHDMSPIHLLPTCFHISCHVLFGAWRTFWP